MHSEKMTYFIEIYLSTRTKDKPKLERWYGFINTLGRVLVTRDKQGAMSAQNGSHVFLIYTKSAPSLGICREHLNSIRFEIETEYDQLINLIHKYGTLQDREEKHKFAEYIQKEIELTKVKRLNL